MQIFIGFVEENARSSVKNITTYVFSGKPLSFSRKLHSARGAKQKQHAPGRDFFCSACAARPLAHSLTHRGERRTRRTNKQKKTSRTKKTRGAKTKQKKKLVPTGSNLFQYFCQLPRPPTMGIADQYLGKGCWVAGCHVHYDIRLRGAI